MNLISKAKNRIKARDTALMRVLYKAAKTILTFDMPPIKAIHLPLHIMFSSLGAFVFSALRTFYWKPVFMLQLQIHHGACVIQALGFPIAWGHSK